MRRRLHGHSSSHRVLILCQEWREHFMCIIL